MLKITKRYEKMVWNNSRISKELSSLGFHSMGMNWLSIPRAVDKEDRENVMNPILTQVDVLPNVFFLHLPGFSEERPAKPMELVGES